ncbi:MAG: maltokinase N-terminal cap-like domain-containing protein [Solirubrobacteraceae bacterium]
MPRLDVTALDEEHLSEWLLHRRWFGSKAREVAHVHVMDLLTLHDGPPALAAALVEARFPGGTHAVYQLLLSLREGVAGEDAIGAVGDIAVMDALADPQACELLGGLLRDEAEIGGDRAKVTFHWMPDVEPPRAGAAVRAIGAEQSNSSVVFGDALVLKAFRRVEAGDNPELEMLRFLSERGFPNIAPLGGWYQYEGEIMNATFGVVQRFIPSARDGWELALDELGSDPERFIGRLSELGAVVGRMHTVLGSELHDPAFAPEEPTDETLALLTATIDEDIERVFIDLPDIPEVAPIAGRGE